jgi:hypothetical protein
VDATGYFSAPLTLPPAGPQAQPQVVEIDVTPWRRVSIRFRPAHATKSDESGSVWYWRPEPLGLVAVK